MRQQIRNAILNPAWVCFLWIGMTVGIAFIETPARFGAATITRPIALDVGRAVFTVLNRAELLALVVLLSIVRVSGRTSTLWAYCGVLALIVLAQSVWLTPLLSARAEMIISGIEPPASWAHAIYSSLELIKMGVLLYLGFSSLQPAGSGGSTGTT